MVLSAKCLRSDPEPPVIAHHSLTPLFVMQAQHRENGTLAAAKICEIEHEEDLEDFAVEIDILSECKHRNIVQLLEAYTFENKLWVSHSLLLEIIFDCIRCETHLFG